MGENTNGRQPVGLNFEGKNPMLALYGVYDWVCLGIGVFFAGYLIAIAWRDGLPMLAAMVGMAAVGALWLRVAGGLLYGVGVVLTARSVCHGKRPGKSTADVRQLRDVFVKHRPTHRLVCRLFGETFDGLAGGLEAVLRDRSPDETS